MIAVAVLVAVAVVMGSTRPAMAADPPPASFTVDIPLPDNWDHATAQAWADDLNTRHALLSDSIKEQLDAYRADLPGAPTETWHDFDGSAAVTGSGLSLTVQVNEVQATDLEWLRDIGLLLATAAMVYAIRFACMAAATGPLGAAAPVLCTPLGGFFGTLIGGAIRNAVTGQLHSWKAWAIVLGAAVGAAILGYGWEGWLNPLVKAQGPNWMASAGGVLRNLGQKIKFWAPATGDAIASTGDGLAANADDIALGIVEGVEQAGANPTNLRVLPLGDSITYGVGTSDNSSYRARLWSLLDPRVDDLDFVGSVDTGQLPDTDNEGHPGWTISQISQIAACTVRTYQPNIVTLHIGTNDMARNVSVAGAPDRLRTLLRRIFEAAPRTTVMLATLIPSTTPATMNRIQAYNAAIPGIAAEFRATGRMVHVVDMGAVTPGDMTDSLHPNATGYRKMGDAFNGAINEILTKGGFGVTQPADFFVDACGGTTGGAGGTTGAVDPSANLDNGWSPMGVVASGAGPRAQVRFADLNGDGRDDYLLVGDQGQVQAWFNTPGGSGGISWQSRGQVASGSGPRDSVRFADINGDGRDDYLVVDSAGVVQGWLNVPGGGGGVSWDSQGVVATGVGATRDEVRFADINGDGRDDYLVLDGAGVAKGWLNNRSASGMSWGYAGVVAAGVGATRDEVRFTDLDGDSRDDYLVVQAQGQVRAWLNTFSESGAGWLVQGEIAGGVGASRADVEFADLTGGGSSDYLVVNSTGQVTAWRNDVFGQEDRWDYQGTVASGVGATLPEVRFADLNGDRKDDYLVVSEQGAVRAWLNNRGGSGSPWTYLGQVAAGAGPRESVRFADLNGDNRDDYLVVSTSGQVQAWFNAGSGNSVSWQAKGVVAAGSGARDTIRFSDIDGDNRDDYLVVGTGGQVQAWRNVAGGSSGVSWQAQGEIAAGVGLPASMITFADIDGDRRGDYLAVSESGRIWAWRNNRGGGGATWLTQGEIATGVGATRDQLHLTDYNGDGRDDYLVSDSAGVVRGWTNNGLVRKG
ncbi:FG-GAP-like repeat-containing protein [Frankia sp. R43]|uniref:FG-GAP-like repeat-containing protein n=1 Tax=Frankia sp. R43 TaxID=269536 RepID=UPI0006CA1C5F|nr:FG-GAP-like repeat-containing protein [Frankia sp. R43]